MPPDFTPVATQIQPPPSALGTISSILGIQQQRQALQTGQYVQQQEQAAGAQAQRVNAEQTAITQMMKSGKDDQGNSIYTTATDPGTGKPEADPVKIMSAIGRIAPLTGQNYVQGILKSVTDKVGLRAASQSLDSQGRALLMGPVQAAANDPNATSATVSAGIDNLVEAHPELGPAAQYLKGLTKHIDSFKDPKARAGAIQTIAATMQGGQPVQTQATPSTQDMGGTVYQGTTAPAVGGGGFTPSTSLGKTTPPAVMTGPNGQIIRVPAGGAGLPSIGGASGGGMGPTGGAQPSPVANPFTRPDGHAWTANDSMPPMNAPAITRNAYGSAVEQAQNAVTTARAADRDYGTNMSLADSIRRLAGNTSTGPGSEPWKQTVGFLGANISDYQTLGAFLDNQATRLQHSMNLPDTNAGLSSAQNIGGKTSYQPGAIMAKNDYLQALTEGAHQYRQMIDRVERFTGTPNPQAVQAAQAAWNANFDPRIYEGEQAYSRSKADGDAFMSKLTPQQAKQLSAKRQALQKLTNGEMPQ